jgi:hypothetical protein
VQRIIRKKTKESNVHTWKPLVERRVHIETNKHTPFMFISSETRNKNKNGRKKETKKNLIEKKTNQ